MVSSDSSDEDEQMVVSPSHSNEFLIMHEKIRKSGVHNYLGEKITLNFKGMDFRCFEERLSNYHDL